MPDQPQTPQQPRPSVPPTNLPARPPAPPSAPRPPMPAPVAPRPPIPPPAPRPPMPIRPPMPAIPPVPPAPITPPKPAPVTPGAVAPKQPGYTSGIRTLAGDIGNISTGKAPTPVKPPVSSPVPPITAPSPVITPPEQAPKSGIGRKLIYGVIILALLAGIFWLVSIFIGSSPQETPTPSPTETPGTSASPSPSAKALSSYFQAAAPTVTLTDATTARQDFLNAYNVAQPLSQQALRMTISSTTILTLGDFLNATAGPLPTDVKVALGQDWAVLAYGQKEQFDQTGQPVANPAVRNRMIILGQLADVSGANQAMAQWEQTLPTQIKDLMSIDISKTLVNTFASGTYRQVAIRYQNFPYADSSLDWAVVKASNGQNYLIIANSREAIFFAIDQLMQ